MLCKICKKNADFHLDGRLHPEFKIKIKDGPGVACGKCKHNKEDILKEYAKMIVNKNRDGVRVYMVKQESTSRSSMKYESLDDAVKILQNATLNNELMDMNDKFEGFKEKIKTIGKKVKTENMKMDEDKS